MNRRILLGAALFLSTAAVGTAFAAATGVLDGEHRSDRRGDDAANADGSFRVAEGRREHGHHGERHHRRHHDDDDDDDHEGGRGRQPRLPQTGPTDPNAPVPDNGLFQGKQRPKVEVQ